MNSKLHDKTEEKILPLMDYALHILIFILIVALFIAILISLFDLFFVQVADGNLHLIINDILFVFILVELFTILNQYLTKHTIRVERIVEVGIISIIREIIFIAFEIEVAKVYAISVLLLSLGGLFFIEKYFGSKKTNNS